MDEWPHQQEILLSYVCNICNSKTTATYPLLKRGSGRSTLFKMLEALPNKMGLFSVHAYVLLLHSWPTSVFSVIYGTVPFECST